MRSSRRQVKTPMGHKTKRGAELEGTPRTPRSLEFSPVRSACSEALQEQHERRSKRPLPWSLAKHGVGPLAAGRIEDALENPFTPSRADQSFREPGSKTVNELALSPLCLNAISPGLNQPVERGSIIKKKLALSTSELSSPARQEEHYEARHHANGHDLKRRNDGLDQQGDALEDSCLSSPDRCRPSPFFAAAKRVVIWSNAAYKPESNHEQRPSQSKADAGSYSSSSSASSSINHLNCGLGKTKECISDAESRPLTATPSINQRRLHCYTASRGVASESSGEHGAEMACPVTGQAMDNGVARKLLLSPSGPNDYKKANKAGNINEVACHQPQAGEMEAELRCDTAENERGSNVVEAALEDIEQEIQRLTRRLAELQMQKRKRDEERKRRVKTDAKGKESSGSDKGSEHDGAGDKEDEEGKSEVAEKKESRTVRTKFLSSANGGGQAGGGREGTAKRSVSSEHDGAGDKEDEEGKSKVAEKKESRTVRTKFLSRANGGGQAGGGREGTAKRSVSAGCTSPRRRRGGGGATPLNGSRWRVDETPTVIASQRTAGGGKLSDVRRSVSTCSRRSGADAAAAAAERTRALRRLSMGTAASSSSVARQGASIAVPSQLQQQQGRTPKPRPVSSRYGRAITPDACRPSSSIALYTSASKKRERGAASASSSAASSPLPQRSSAASPLKKLATLRSGYPSRLGLVTPPTKDRVKTPTTTSSIAIVSNPPPCPAPSTEPAETRRLPRPDPPSVAKSTAALYQCLESLVEDSKHFFKSLSPARASSICHLQQQSALPPPPHTLSSSSFTSSSSISARRILLSSAPPLEEEEDSTTRKVGDALPPAAVDNDGLEAERTTLPSINTCRLNTVRPRDSGCVKRVQERRSYFADDLHQQRHVGDDGKRDDIT